MANITNQLIDDFNNILFETGSIIRLKPDREYICLTVSNKRYLDTFILNPTDEFYDMLISWFKHKNIELTFNNTKSTFWAKGV